MEIRKSEIKDLDDIMEIYTLARAFMTKTGNANQWIDGYPSRELITGDIGTGTSYVCVDDDEIVATFCFRQEDDPTYAVIYDGEWLNDKPYGVVHRLAGTGKKKGVGVSCLEWCFDQCGNIRVDTHHDNIVMQGILERIGYKPCGIIYVANGTKRIAYQKTR